VKTAGFWTKDWFLGLAVAIVLFLLAGSDLIQSLERKAYDLGVRATDRGAPSDRIAVVAIDDVSIQNIGRWPWPRDVHATVTDMLAAEYQKAVPGPNAVEQGSPLATIGQLLAEAESKIAHEPAPDILQFNPKLRPPLVAVLDRAMAKESEARFQTGEEFAHALRASVGAQRPQVDITV
jgi:serine/threonine-protein kinase